MGTHPSFAPRTIGNKKMKLWLRIALYIGGGGLIISWIDPPRGIGQYGLILLLIVGAAYLDLWLSRPRPLKWQGENIISLASVRQSRNKRHGTFAGGRERRILQEVYTSAYHSEVDELLELLRSEGLNPIMILQNRPKGDNGPIFEVRLPAKEVAKAKPLIQFFRAKSAKTPS